MSKNPVIVSLTSIKARYENRILLTTLDSLVDLNYDNYIIVLNISKEPKYLDTGFTDDDIKYLNFLYPKIRINIVENYGSIRKIIPTLKLFTDNIIITVDDDVIYDKNLITTFVDVYNIHKCIVSSRCRNIQLDLFDNITNYSMGNKDECKLGLLPEGVGGILYHSSMFDSKFINFDFNNLEEEFLKNDDLLLRASTLIKNINVYFKYCPYDDQCAYGLFMNYNLYYQINFCRFIEKVNFILNY
jgi:hypothetical protein